jgi:WhiB family redox-sensing transcriptional regulator
MEGIATEREWYSDARCRGLPTEVFYPPDNERGIQRRHREQYAKSICLGCPVVLQCARHALEVGEAHGVWGAMTPHERARTFGVG